MQEPLTRRSGRTRMLRHCAIGKWGRPSTARKLDSTPRETCYAQGLRTREREANNEPTKTRSLSLSLSLSLSVPLSLSLSLSLSPSLSLSLSLPLLLVVTRTSFCHDHAIHARALLRIPLCSNIAPGQAPLPLRHILLCLGLGSAP